MSFRQPSCRNSFLSSAAKHESLHQNSCRKGISSSCADCVCLETAIQTKLPGPISDEGILNFSCLRPFKSSIVSAGAHVIPVVTLAQGGLIVIMKPIVSLERKNSTGHNIHEITTTLSSIVWGMGNISRSLKHNGIRQNLANWYHKVPVC